MGFIRDIFEEIREEINYNKNKRISIQKEKEERLYLERVDDLKDAIRKYSFNDKDTLTYSIEDIREEYKDILFEDDFIFRKLKDKQWEFLSVLNDDERDVEIRKFANYFRDKCSSYYYYYDDDNINYRTALEYFPNSIFQDKNFIEENSTIFPNLISRASNELRQDEEFLKKLFDKKFSIIRFFDENMYSKPEFMLDLIKRYPEAMAFVSKDILDRNFLEEASNINKSCLYYVNPNVLKENVDLMLSCIDDNPDRFEKLIHSYITSYDVDDRAFLQASLDLLETDKSFCLELIDRGYLETYRDMDYEFMKDPEILNAIVDKFKEFDVSLDYDIYRIAQYPSRLREIFKDIDFCKERELLAEKVDLKRPSIDTEEKLEMEI